MNEFRSCQFAVTPVIIDHVLSVGAASCRCVEPVELQDPKGLSYKEREYGDQGCEGAGMIPRSYMR